MSVAYHQRNNNVAHRTLPRLDSFRSVGTYGSQRSFRRRSISDDETNDVLAFAEEAIPTATPIIDAQPHPQPTPSPVEHQRQQQHLVRQNSGYWEDEHNKEHRVVTPPPAPSPEEQHYFDHNRHNQYPPESEHCNHDNITDRGWGSNSPFFDQVENRPNSCNGTFYHFPPQDRAAMFSARERGRQRAAFYCQQRSTSNRSLNSSNHSCGQDNSYSTGSTEYAPSTAPQHREYSHTYAPHQPYCRGDHHDNLYNNDYYDYEFRGQYSSRVVSQDQQPGAWALQTREQLPMPPRSRPQHTNQQYKNDSNIRHGIRSSYAPSTGNRDYGKISGSSRARQQQTYVEIMPGVEERLRSSIETLNAIENDFYRPVTCFDCSNELLCIADASYLLCPDCRVVSPVDEDYSAKKTGGVGMGFSYDDLFKWQSEIVQQRR